MFCHAHVGKENDPTFISAFCLGHFLTYKQVNPVWEQELGWVEETGTVGDYWGCYVCGGCPDPGSLQFFTQPQRVHMFNQWGGYS